MRSKHLLNPLGALLNYCNESEFDHCVNIFPVSGGAEYFGHRLHFITFTAIPILIYQTLMHGTSLLIYLVFKFRMHVKSVKVYVSGVNITTIFYIL